ESEQREEHDRPGPLRLDAAQTHEESFDHVQLPAGGTVLRAGSMAFNTATWISRRRALDIADPSNSTSRNRSKTRPSPVRTSDSTICTRCPNSACASEKSRPERSVVSTSRVARPPA